ncbi:MAG: glycosyltransferase [Saprospiraceae bacterium]|nr:glycosyltransferase [Saprospiraceae bacterium]
MTLQDSKKNVLICPQHWGLGHVTRTIPIIHYFLNRSHRVVLACSGAGSDLLKLEFPQLPIYEIVDYGMTYPTGNMYLNMGLQIFQLHKAIWKEKKQIAKICQQEQVDLIISDSRFGASQKSIPSVIISHHLHLPLGNKFLEIMIDRWMRIFYVKFDQIWTPDFVGNVNLSGELSHLFKSNKHHFIGPVSRFDKKDLAIKYQVAFLLSGPEPQRTYFENQILDQLKNMDLKNVILIRGTQLPSKKVFPSYLEVIDLATGDQLNNILYASELIVSRSGYTTLMDLAVIKKPALLVPTPVNPNKNI